MPKGKRTSTSKPSSPPAASSPPSKKQKKSDVVLIIKGKSYTRAEIGEMADAEIAGLASKQCNCKFFVNVAQKNVECDDVHKQVCVLLDVCYYYRSMG